jgi:hypothetical protein
VRCARGHESRGGGGARRRERVGRGNEEERRQGPLSPPNNRPNSEEGGAVDSVIRVPRVEGEASPQVVLLITLVYMNMKGTLVLRLKRMESGRRRLDYIPS